MDKTRPRGIRNNNPGNIERGRDKWDGMSQDQSGDDRFIVFDGPIWGIRAMAKILLNYQRIYSLKTTEDIIGRWAPKNENDTREYARFVADQCGIGIKEEIDLKSDDDFFDTFIRSMIHLENGECPYDTYLVRQAIAKAKL